VKNSPKSTPQIEILLKMAHNSNLTAIFVCSDSEKEKYTWATSETLLGASSLIRDSKDETYSANQTKFQYQRPCMIRRSFYLG